NRTIQHLLTAMQERTSTVKPADLGTIGYENFRYRFDVLGADLETFEYKVIKTEDDERLPVLIEAAFAYAPGLQRRMLFTGVNFSPAINNPFRQLGWHGEGLERVLAGQMVEAQDPLIVALHLAAPVITYLDRGKSSIALGGGKPDPEVE